MADIEVIYEDNQLKNLSDTSEKIFFKKKDNDNEKRNSMIKNNEISRKEGLMSDLFKISSIKNNENVTFDNGIDNNNKKITETNSINISLNSKKDSEVNKKNDFNSNENENNSQRNDINNLLFPLGTSFSSTYDPFYYGSGKKSDNSLSNYFNSINNNNNNINTRS